MKIVIQEEVWNISDESIHYIINAILLKYIKITDVNICGAQQTSPLFILIILLYVY